MPKDLGRQINWTSWVYILHLTVKFGNTLDQIFDLREYQLKPGVINALAKSN